MPKIELTPEFLARKTFDLYQTHGVPIEVSEDILTSKGLNLDSALLNKLIEDHQRLSQSSSAGQFKSGLAGDSSTTRALHTATHLLHQSLREMFGDSVVQRGSAITEQKARFDFSLDAKELSDEKITELQSKIQNLIDKHLQMLVIETTPDEAKAMGAIGLFGEKYGEKVTVYTLHDNQGKVYSREFCGGPHVKNTDEIKKFHIIKKKSIGSGLSRLEFTVG